MAKTTWMTPEDWLQSLDSPTRAIADEKIAFLTQLEARNPVQWIASEMRDGIAQTARFLVLWKIRLTVAEQYYKEGLPERDVKKLTTDFKQILQDATGAIQRLLASGASADDLHSIARAAAYQAAFSAVMTIDEGMGWEAEQFPEAPDWALMERSADGKLTGRSISGLHESFSHLFTFDE